MGWRVVRGPCWLPWCPERDSNPHTPQRVADFKSAASTASAIRARPRIIGGAGSLPAGAARGSEEARACATAGSVQGSTADAGDGGASRSRTGLDGFAIRCITALLSRHGLHCREKGKPRLPFLDVSGAGNETFTRRVSRCFPNTFFAEVASEDLDCSLVFHPRQQDRPKSSTGVHRPALSTPAPHSSQRRQRRSRTGACPCSRHPHQYRDDVQADSLGAGSVRMSATSRMRRALRSSSAQVVREERTP